jgi:hypothetical protein
MERRGRAGQHHRGAGRRRRPRLTPADDGRDTGQAPLGEGTAEASVPLETVGPPEVSDREPPHPLPSSVGVRSGRLEDLPAAGPVPVGVRIEAAGVDAAVVPVGVEPGSGRWPSPTTWTSPGWYRFGPAPGDPGSAVLSAHVDSARQGLGAFFPLREVAPGSGVTVTFDDGSARRFEVVARRSYDKDALPLAELFTRDGEPVLTLVTCGGRFDPATSSYEENLVVFAVPAGAT